MFSIPNAKYFIYKNCIEKENGLVEITKDPFEISNSIILKRLEDG